MWCFRMLAIVCLTITISLTRAANIDAEFRKRFPYKIGGVTYDGGPVLTIPYGDWDIPKSFQKGEREKLRELYYEIFEKLAGMSRGEKKKVKSGIVIFDMKNYTLSQGFNPEANAFMVEMTNYFETKYDNRILKRWYLINTPPPIQLAYNLLKLFLPERARSKWQVLGPSRIQWQWQLFKDVSPEELTSQYGGVKDV